MSNSPPEDAAAPVKITLEDAIRAAQNLQRSQKLAEAEDVYQQILALVPNEPNALHYLGVLRHQQKRHDEALELIRRAADLLPGDSGPWLNLGNVLLETKRLDDAVDAYKQAADYAPDNVLIYSNLGLLHARRHCFDLAEECYKRALAIAPKAEYALINYAQMLRQQGRYEESVGYGLKTLVSNPDEPKARRILSTSYVLLGDMEAARTVIREWLEREPDNPEAVHLLASVGGLEAPPRASDAYIVSEFDAFAKSFDAKLEALGYRAPELVTNALRHAIAPAAVAGAILDAGCGTGLCAPLLKPMAHRLDGVDLSAGMLDKARERGGYDHLAQAELTAYITAHTAHWDVLVSADTLCYFGDLSPVFAAANGALRAGGWLVFSVEALLNDDKNYQLTYHGRFEHAHPYLERSLRAAGFDPLTIEKHELRKEVMRPVWGWVVTARKPAA